MNSRGNLLSLHFAGSLVLLAAIAALSVWGDRRLPQGRYAVHWNAFGQVDSYGPKELLLWPPLWVSVGTVGILYGLMLTLPAVVPESKQGEVRQTTAFLPWVAAAALVSSLLIHAASLAVAVGYAVNLPQVTGGATGAVLVLLGLGMSRLRIESFAASAGSVHAWRKFQAAMTRTFAGAGGICLILALIAPPIVGTVFLGAIVPAAVLAVIGRHWFASRRGGRGYARVRSSQ